MEEFFNFLKERIAGARKYAVAGRDYALFRTLYLAGLRAEESASLDRADVHFGRGPLGKVHVRFGKGAKTSDPRPRWVPMLDGLDLILGWYLTEIAPRLGEGPALFCDEGGGRISRGTIRNRLAHLLDLEATASGEAGPGSAGLVRRDSCDVSQMRGHLHVGTTKRYVTPLTTLVDAANRRAVSGTLPDLGGAGDGVQPESTDGVRRSWA